MLGAAGFKTSVFDNKLEDDFEGAEQTLVVKIYFLINYTL